VKANQADFPVRRLCRVLRVSASGYYDWLERSPSRRARGNAELMQRISEIHRTSDATYGVPRIHAELAEQGIVAGHNRIARLMRLYGLRGVSRRRGWCVTTRRDKDRQPAPDLVQRRFEATDINQLWVADMTYIPTWAGFGYLAVVLDVFSRKIVGWAFGQRQTADLVLAALNMALLTRKPASVIHHSDQGSTPAWSSASAAPRWAFAPRWAASVMPTTTPWPSASSQASSASSSIAASGRPSRRRAWRSSPGSRAGTTRADVTAAWVRSRR
jgi:putative transposase